MDNKKIFLRFLKEIMAYNSFRTEQRKIIDNDNFSSYDIIDKSFTWERTKKGYKFWFEVQINYVSLLLQKNENLFWLDKRDERNVYFNKELKLKDYMHSLLYEYSSNINLTDFSFFIDKWNITK